MGTHCVGAPNKAALYFRFCMGDFLCVSSYIAQSEF